MVPRKPWAVYPPIFAFRIASVNQISIIKGKETCENTQYHTIRATIYHNILTEPLKPMENHRNRSCNATKYATIEHISRFVDDLFNKFTVDVERDCGRFTITTTADDKTHWDGSNVHFKNSLRDTLLADNVWFIIILNLLLTAFEIVSNTNHTYSCTGLQLRLSTSTQKCSRSRF